MRAPRSATNPLRVAIVGSGPSGFYAPKHVKSPLTVRVDMIERLPVPFGLVRYGALPIIPNSTAHVGLRQELRNSGLHFLGNVTVGRDRQFGALQSTHHAVLFASGAGDDRRLGFADEDLAGSHTATEFVGWYNGHPDYRDRSFDLSREVAVNYRPGQCRIDVARILSKSVGDETSSY